MIFCIIFIPWGTLSIVYLGTIFHPNCFYVCKENEDKQWIAPGSILDKLYIDKSVTPKLKTFAISFLIFFAANIIITAIILILYYCFNLPSISDIISMSYSGFMLIVSAVHICIFRLKK
ncbi:MAG: hypothetical protein HUJ68_14390 [Clostridia bacterium]|nr:hypothetical protein [Clostridia bacterium]